MERRRNALLIPNHSVRKVKLHLPGDGEVKDYVAAAWRSALFILPANLREILREKQLWEDVQQEILLSAIIASRQGLGLRETRRLVQREVCRALREMGLRKARNGRWEWREEVWDGITDEEEDMNEGGGDEDEC
jgi:hypothetical protein